MEPADATDSHSTGKRLKLVRLIDQYDLQGMGQTLEQRWTAEEAERSSLRDLADYFNRELLSTAMSDAGMQPLDGEVQNVYRLLTDDEVSGADRTRMSRRLEREGIDVDKLVDDFVTYQAVRTYLTTHREAEYTQPDRDRTADGAENIQRLRGRTATVTEGKLDQLHNSGDITLGEFRTVVDITVLCEDCGGQYGVTELLDSGGCDCPDDESS